MADLKDLYEQRDELIKEVVRLRDLVSKDEAVITADLSEQWDKANSALTQIEQKIKWNERTNEFLSSRDETTEKGERIASELRKKSSPARTDLYQEAYGARAPSEEQRALAIQGWAFRQSGRDLSEAHRSAARICGINLESNEIEMRLCTSREVAKKQIEFRAQSIGVDSAGGYLVPTGFSNALERALLTYGSVRRVARIIRTATANDIPMPTVNDTSNKGERIGENKAQNEKDVAFGSLVLKHHKYSSKIIRVSSEFLRDSAFDMASELGSIIGERLGRIMEEEFTTGTGGVMPNGVVTSSYLGKTATSATAITADEIIDLVHSVDIGYRVNARFMLHDLILAAVRKLKDDNGAYLWQPNLQLGIPPSLYGYGYEINQEMNSTLTASSKVVLFGDFSKYIVREVAGLRLKRMGERYAEYDQEGFVGYLEGDGQLLNAGTNPIKHLITAAS